MYEIFGITENLCMALQEKTQDIVNAMDVVKTTSSLLQLLRSEGWNSFLVKLESFCSKHQIDVPAMRSTFYWE